ncbi:prephenate dehydrogenase [Pontibacillus halophilus JSM 076056 = DSM 19796]|uniref:Prephenate dehydrogenase n=1 Tax=Pontibacillus halophilus JSM 076056 = DSM 19796 TaxID=1385510 RepID=A0A0A5I8I9_9BACI|nr:prephenate dehydrogenase [Pontibacillus halophilus]KGX92157.1 prephenate dehydrogenase [Pontibacillus halophilus JSM 076056 = DSM 19796]
MTSPTVLVVGLGLIGGSLSMNLRKEAHVVGWDENPASLQYALEHNVIDVAAESFEQGVHEADVVLFGTPIPITIQYLQIIDDMVLTKRTLITDVGSVKKPIMEVAEQLTNPQLAFVGGHPMAGSHKNGVKAAKAHLFENAFYLLVTNEKCTHDDLVQLKQLLSHTKSRFVEVDELAHDHMTGVISHFPHLIASSLVHQARNWQETYPFMHELAAGGFRDITRIASSHPTMWKDILFQNKDTILALLQDWIDEMGMVKGMLEAEQRSTLEQYLDDARNYRDGLPVEKRGALPSFYDVFVDIEDQPGAISHVTSVLASRELSVVNIEILEIREGITGVLRLSFQKQVDQTSAKSLLEENGYEATIQS